MTSFKDVLKKWAEELRKQGVEVEIFEDAVDEFERPLKARRQGLSARLVEEARRRYPGIPVPLAVARLLAVMPVLASIRPVKGHMWGGLHEEDLPEVVAKLVRSMYEGARPIRSITIKIEVEDPSCEDYTHFWVSVEDVEYGPEG